MFCRVIFAAAALIALLTAARAETTYTVQLANLADEKAVFATCSASAPLTQK